jgi:sigma-B regulation protein RsbU (phosphoserine phosphatase)
LGTIWGFDRRVRVPDEREIHVLESIAAQIAAVLERVVLLCESETKHRLQRDLEVASESQTKGMLHGLPAGLPFDVAGACTSRYELGGDLCEVLSIDAEHTVVAVGDASGDSVPAAMVMSAVRGALRALASVQAGEIVHTERVMERLNRMLCDITPAHQFMSLLVGLLDSFRGVFTYSNAGHPLPILVRDGAATLLHSHGMLLGVLKDSTYDLSAVPLMAGDMLVLYSDGVSEAMDRRRKMFRSEGIIEAVHKHLAKPAREIVQAIWSDLDAHLGDGTPDDRTLLVITMPA